MAQRAQQFLLAILILLFSGCGDSSTGPEPPEPDPPTDPDLEVPTLLTPDDQEENAATTMSFNWEPVENAQTYHLQISNNEDFSNLLVDEPNFSEVSYVADNLTKGNDYYWRVQATSGSNSGPWSEKRTFNVKQMVTYAEETKILPERSATMVSDTTTNLESITFTGSSDYLENLKEGEIIIGAPSTKLPYGILKKVNKITRSGNLITVETERATLEEAIDEATIRIRRTLSPDQIVGSKVNFKGFKLDKSKASSGPELNFNLANIVLFDADGNKGTTNDQMVVNGNINLKTTIIADIDISRLFGIETFLFKFETDYNSNVRLESKVQAGTSNTHTLAEYTFAPFTAGAVSIYPEAEINLGAEGQITAGLSSGMTYNANLNVGFERKDGDWSPISGFEESTDFVPVQAELGAKAKVYSELKLSTEVYGFAGPFVDLQGYFRAEVKPLEDPWWLLYWGLQANVGARVEAFKITWAEYTVPNIIGKEWSLADAGGPKQNSKLSYSPESLSFPAGGAEKALSITNSGTGALNWEVSSGADWISFDPATGSGQTEVTVTAGENMASQQRTAEIQITSNGGDSNPITVTQAKAEAQPEPKLSVSPASLSFAAAAESKTLSITNSGSGTLEWQVSSGAGWLSFGKSSGTGDTDLTTSTQENTTGQQRSAEISVTSNGGNQTIMVSQSEGNQGEPKLSYSPDSFEASSEAGEYTLSIKNTGSGNLDWYIRYEGEWLSFEPQSGEMATDVKITVQENTTGQKRSTNISLNSSGGAARIPFEQNKKEQETSNNFYLASNGVTVKCEDAAVSESGTVNDFTYTKRTRDQITPENAANTCTSGISDMSNLFEDAISFDQDISSWDVSSVSNMAAMFAETKSFNQDIGSWDVSSVSNMAAMFAETGSFNQNISDWDVSNVRNMKRMFQSSLAFNRSLNSWNVSNVKEMNGMFEDTESFNKDISNWDVSNVENMGYMFNDSFFDKDIGNWNVSNVTHMNNMFEDANSFDQDIGGWDVSNVKSMREMFLNAAQFNQDISQWNTGNVTNMDYMFKDARSFGQDISNWCVSKIDTEPEEFSFRSGLSEEQEPIWGTCPE